jgi:hypothetical protein
VQLNLGKREGGNRIGINYRQLEKDGRESFYPETDRTARYNRQRLSAGNKPGIYNGEWSAFVTNPGPKTGKKPHSPAPLVYLIRH